MGLDLANIEFAYRWNNRHAIALRDILDAHPSQAHINRGDATPMHAPSFASQGRPLGIEELDDFGRYWGRVRDGLAHVLGDGHAASHLLVSFGQEVLAGWTAGRGHGELIEELSGYA